jgi:hypothetical protein
MSLVDLGGVEEQVDPTFNDTNRALRENLQFSKGEPVDPPAPWQTDAIHIEIHFAQMNSSEWDAMQPEQKIAMMQHVILHLRRHNPQMGLEIAQMLVTVAPGPETESIIQDLTMLVQGQQAAAPPPDGSSPPAGPPGPSGAPAPPPQ